MEDRINRGTAMVASLWHESDGNEADFVDFCMAHFMSDSEREKNLELVIENLKVLQGYSSIIRSRFTEYSSFTDRDEMPPDAFFRNAIPSTDPWKSKLAFFLQLNYPNINPKEVIEQGAAWDRKTWAKARIGDWYAFRRPDDDFQVPYREEASRFNRHISIPKPPGEADWLGTSIQIRPVITGGYASRPPIPGYPALFTAPFPENGLDYKGFRIAMHELGHVTEMLYSQREADYSILEGVPTGAITEGVAEYFAYRNITALGLDEGSQEEIRHLQALASFWYNVDMGGQALTEIEVWKWMSANPDAGPEQVMEAMLEISRSVWNEYFAPVFGIRDQHILSIYNHMITGSLYLYNYFIGNVVMFQLYEGLRNESLETGLARACGEGNTLPDLWMNKAVGKNISIQPLLRATGEAVEFFSGH
jgi:hypothetical protein